MSSLFLVTEKSHISHCIWSIWFDFKGLWMKSGLGEQFFVMLSEGWSSDICLSHGALFELAMHFAALGLFSHDGKVRILNFNSRCAFWIKIQNTQKRQCVCQITSQNVIWNAHLKSRYRGVFQLRFSQIMQRNLCMNDLTSESCFGGRS